MTHPRCDTCCFALPDEDYSYPDDSAKDIGIQCRRRSPIATGGMMSPTVTIWPKVKRDDWCGEYSRSLPNP